MPAFLTCSLILCAYLMSIQALFRHVRTSVSKLALLLAPVAFLVLSAFALCAFTLKTWDPMLMLVAMAVPAAAIIIGMRSFSSYRNELNLAMLALFILSLLAVGYVTLFSRDGSTSTRVLFQLRNITRALRSGSLLYLKHLVMNIILFIPFGFLLSASCPGKSDRLLVVITYALLFSAAVESLQYLLVIGECDLEDVLGNVLGAWTGLGIFRLYRLLQ